MESKGKLRMSNKTFRMILVPIMAVVLVLALVANIGMNLFASVMDDYLGRGEAKRYTAEGTENWDTEYYEDLYANMEESKAASYVLAAKVQEEGSVLLKNNGVLPLEKGSDVTPFGYRYLTPIYGQVSSSGSAKWTISPITPEDGLKDFFTINNAAVDLMKAAGEPTAIMEAPGTLSAGSLNDLMGGDSKIYEYDATIYDRLDSSLSDTTAIVVIARAGQEGSDKKYDGYEDGTPHYLALSKNEMATIARAKELCQNVVVVLATSAAMEVAPLMSGDLEVDAILQVGHVGEKGFAALGRLLCGEVNPSGRTVDIWATDFTKDPTYQNFGAFTYTNATFTSHAYGSPSSDRGDGTFGRYFIEYEEDMYMGYRYYETAAVEDPSFVYGVLDGKGAFATPGAVAYPFGYGLSYSTFAQSIVSYDDSGDSISLTVKVENTGSAAGKDVIQIYYSAPYTQMDRDMKIEKPVTQLIAFEKTGILQPGESQEIEISFLKEDMASYCYTRDNGDGSTGAYVLEAGDYQITLCSNSHDVIESKSWSNGDTVWYDSSNPRQSEIDAQSALDTEGNPMGVPAKGDDTAYHAATNLFSASSDYMNEEATILSRSDWTGTFPSRPANDQKEASDKTAASFGIEETFDVNNDPMLGNVEGSLVYAEVDPQVRDSGLTVSSMRGLDFYDPLWEDFLDQIDYGNGEVLSQIVSLMIGSNYATTPVAAIGLVPTVEADGANGIKAVKTDDGMKMSATYGYAPLMASTWNKELMYEVGRMFGQEAMETGVSGWYSPAINLHRSPFSGRVFEYYSEDPVLTGKIASAVVSGAGDAGMFCYIKHFALNDQETNREFFLHTWATEQSMRELYLKAFEIPFKEARMTISYIVDQDGTRAEKTMRAATAVMASQNDIGATIAHANYALLTSLLRGEWGFTGLVHTDMYVWAGEKNMFDLTFRAGSDTFLTFEAMSGIVDKDSPTAHAVMRRALHDISYTIANSAAMQGTAPGSITVYSTSPWRIALIAADVVVGVVLALGVVWIVLRTQDEKKHSERYKSSLKNNG